MNSSHKVARRFQASIAKESAVDFDRYLPMIADLVGRNHHVEAYALGSKMLGLGVLAQKFELVSQIQKLEGSIPPGVNKYRDSLYDDLMREAERKLSPDEYEEFHASF